MNNSEARQRHTHAVGKCDERGKVLVPNGHKGRSQKGCFGKPKNIINKEK